MLQSRVLIRNEKLDAPTLDENRPSKSVQKELAHDEQQFEELFELMREKDDGSVLGPNKVRVRSEKVFVRISPIYKFSFT